MVYGSSEESRAIASAERFFVTRCNRMAHPVASMSGCSSEARTVSGRALLNAAGICTTERHAIESRREESAMGPDSGALVKTLNKTCLSALQAASGLCLTRTNPSVEVEHWLLKLAEAPNTDLTRIFRQFEVDPSRVQRDLTRTIDQFQTGTERKPTLGNSIDQTIGSA